MANLGWAGLYVCAELMDGLKCGSLGWWYFYMFVQIFINVPASINPNEFSMGGNVVQWRVFWDLVC